MDIVEFNGKLYGGTGSTGLLLEWNETNAWIKVADQLNTQTINCLCVFNNKLYAGTSPGGRLFEWNGTDAWSEKASAPNASTYINDMLVFNNELYAVSGSSLYNGSWKCNLLKWNGTNAWTKMAPSTFEFEYATRNLWCLCKFNGVLYAGTDNQYELMVKWNGTDDWEYGGLSYASGTSNVRSLCVYNNELYAATGTAYGRLLKWDGVDSWTLVAELGYINTTAISMLVYNNKLMVGYYGQYSYGSILLQWDGSTYTQKAAQLNSQVWCRALLKHNGKLFGCTQATSAGGRLFEWITV
jgi:hypothetical protein